MSEGAVQTSTKDKRRERRQHRFLVAYIKPKATITSAAEAAGIARDTHYKWTKEDPAYVELWNAAQKTKQELEEEREEYGLELIGNKSIDGLERYEPKDFSDAAINFERHFKMRRLKKGQSTENVQANLTAKRLTDEEWAEAKKRLESGEE